MRESAAVHELEIRFHDEWAAATRAAEVDVLPAFEGLTAPENRFILSRMGPLGGKRVLDVGTGLGEAAVYFALAGAEVTALDISPGMVAAARALAGRHGVEIEALVQSAEELAVEPRSYDFVYAANVLHHVTDRERFFRAVHAALRPGGRFFTWDPLIYNPAIHVYRRLATAVRTADEAPLSFAEVRLARRYFEEVGHREFWIATLLLFLKYYFLDRLDPGAVRYWKRILKESGAGIGWWFRPLQRLDRVLTRLPLVRRLAWNMVLWGRRAPD